MAEFRQWLHAQCGRLDGARERKIVGLGALALLVLLNVGPTVVSTMAHALATDPSSTRPESAPPTSVIVMTLPETASASSSEEAAAPEEGVENAPPAVAPPPLAFLFPLSGAEAAGPVTIGVRLENATAIAMLFEVTDPKGNRIATLPAAPSLSDEWSALFSAEPGEYVVSARASLLDGRVVAFQEQRAFRLLSPAMPAEPADPAEPSLELLSPEDSRTYGSTAPLSARVKNAEPAVLVFLVTAPDGYETLVLGTEASGSGYWTGMFEGSDGIYRVRARVTIGDRDIFSPESAFTLEAARR